MVLLLHDHVFTTQVISVCVHVFYTRSGRRFKAVRGVCDGSGFSDFCHKSGRVGVPR